MPSVPNDWRYGSVSDPEAELNNLEECNDGYEEQWMREEELRNDPDDEEPEDLWEEDLG